MEIKKRHNLKNWNLKQKDNFTTILVFICKISCIFIFLFFHVIIKVFIYAIGKGVLNGQRDIRKIALKSRTI
jgi:hypothetical protein